MKKDVSIQCRGGSVTRTIVLPNTCPHCGEKMLPHVLGEGFSQNTHRDYLINFGILVHCTITSCSKYFALQYINKHDEECTPEIYEYKPPIKVDLPENIDKVSSAFVEIYSQATTAESENLDQIAGVGYRKSLEFLIKDHAIRNNPDKEEEIKKKMLGPVITEYLTDFPKLKNLARAATWLGNDETHYERRHTEKDIRDMKAFIRSASQFIAADYDADIAEEFINQ